MTFSIQASNPRFSENFDEDDETLDEALETVFPLNAEAAVLNWSGAFALLSYKYDLSCIVSDVMMMLQQILSMSSGKLRIAWPSNTFAATWNLAWDSSNVTIDAQWASVVGSSVEDLNNVGALEIPRAEFLAEWKQLLRVAASGLEKCGYNEQNLPAMKELREVISKIPKHGSLYE